MVETFLVDKQMLLIINMLISKTIHLLKLDKPNWLAYVIEIFKIFISKNKKLTITFIFLKQNFNFFTKSELKITK